LRRIACSNADGFLVWLDLAESDARSIVDANMDELPAGASATALAFAVASDAVTGTVEAPEFLGVDVDQSTGTGIFITARRLGRFEVLHAAQTGAFQHPADGRRRHAGAHGDVLSGQPLTTQGDDLIDNKELGRAMECAWTRGPVIQTGEALGTITRDPFPHRPRADACGSVRRPAASARPPPA
jgi:hypothetical protein